MAVTPRQDLGASTVNRKWWVDVNTGTATAPVWTGVFGITNLTPGTIDSNMEDDSDYNSGGFMSSTKTAEGWSLEMTVSRKVQADAPTAYDPGQEFLRDLGSGKFGSANSCLIRWYEMGEGEDQPRVEAYEGRAAVGYSPEGGDMKSLATAKITLTGQGRRRTVAHPDLVA